MKTKLLIVILAVLALPSFAQKKVSILGDSYSTYGGLVSPSWNLCWYNGTDGGGKEKNNDVKEPEQTWWNIVIKDMGYALEKNNSFSGSTVCYTGYRKEDYSDRAFITRMPNLGNPDIILILGGTNDSWAGAPIGEYQWEGWTRADLYSFRPAFCLMISYLKQNYPDARIVNICNSELKPEVTETERVVCEHYGVEHILLHDIDKQWGHPSIAGMKAISEQVEAVLKK